MNGVFWHQGLGFVADRRWGESHFEGGLKIVRFQVSPVLEGSGRLPDLGRAPITSWLVSRLFHLTREQLPFEPEARLCNDGGGIYLHFIAFTESLQPVAFLYMHGISSGIQLWGECAAGTSPGHITSVFQSALLQAPQELLICKLTTLDMDPPDLPHRGRGKPEVFGWDGKKFLGDRGG